MAAINRANHACIRLNPYGVPTMKQSYASAGKAPRRRVHSLSGIAAIAECGLPPPRIVIGYPTHQAQSGAKPCLSFLVLACCSHRRPQFDTVRALARWYRTRTEGPSGARKTTMIVALARKLLIALWRLVTTGEVPDGVELRPAV